jgi:two-component system, LytTR family, response regulator
MKTFINLKCKQSVAANEVIQMEANINYTTLKLISGKKIVVTSTLKYFETLLSKDQFFRVNKSTMLNRAFIKHIEKDQITLQNEEIFVISRRRVRSILALMAS